MSFCRDFPSCHTQAFAAKKKKGSMNQILGKQTTTFEKALKERKKKKKRGKQKKNQFLFPLSPPPPLTAPITNPLVIIHNKYLDSDFGIPRFHECHVIVSILIYEKISQYFLIQYSLSLFFKERVLQLLEEQNDN